MTNDKALATQDYSKYSGMGMKGITQEDIKPPMMFLVNKGIENKADKGLVDVKGNDCPDGHYFIKSSKEVMKTVKGYIVWVKKGYMEAPADHATEAQIKWHGSKQYKVLFVRKNDFQPIVMTFKKTSNRALSDLFTVSKMKNLPIFVFEVELVANTETNQNNQSYFVANANVIGTEKDKEVLNKLFITASEVADKGDVEEGEDVTPADVKKSGMMDEEAPQEGEQPK